ncbi:high-affinity choline transporter 1-like isoform X2 [Zootermopsis nevadensis]|uniref:High-affinity choline transporter 1 n=3 Tax=Zootermopsis nevadensis TaxID=136037 RepID=A0A067RWP0_ZOONE|nr:high-affinity choline transporter 1-like isoform X2 [Zootermopsis nevadensis]XP_021914015.1 high-affinity choline transporter 1-like isoform X2 [Zootermopsis nevadensis]KDR24329.1 High-affinity choline transporter 1 [Zootermopsis nevadensis]
MAIYVWGLVGIVVFYIAMLGVGIWAGTKQKNHGEEEVMLAGRSIGTVVGFLTLIATWVGGAYINGTAEVMFTTGLAWCQVPIGYSLSIILAMLLFVRQMREARYVTMLDPMQQKYGSQVGGLLYIPALCGDVFWTGSILNALGSSLVVILDIDSRISVIASAVFAAAYTIVGGFYSVSYTDVLQLILIVIGLLLSVPFAYQNEAVSKNVLSSTNWVGKVERADLGEWFDSLLLLIFGGIPWQGYFQRIFSMKTTKSAQILSVVSFFGCVIMAFPPAFIGIVAKSTDWANVEGFRRNVSDSEGEIILPLVLRYLTPNWVSFFGLGAISAAVMSSADASILSSSSMFSRNIYKAAFRPKAGDREMLWVLRISVMVIATLGAITALTVGSVYYLSYLCADLIYVILFPQLLLIIHWAQGVNTYGCLASYFIGLFLRVLGGEKRLGIPAVIKFPYYDEVTETQKFPFKTLCMFCALSAHLLVSTAARLLFEHRYIEADKWDVLKAFPHLKSRNTDTEFRKGFDEISMSGTYKGTEKVGIVNTAAVTEKIGIVNTAVVTDSTDDIKNSIETKKDYSTS